MALSAWADRGEFDTPLDRFLPKGLPRPNLDTKAILGKAGLR